MKIFQHSTGSYDKRAVCQLRATAHYHFCRDSIARVPLNGRNRLDGNRVGWPPFRTFSTNRATRRRRHHHHHRFIPPRLTLRSHQPRNRRPTPTCSCFTSEPRPFLGRYETSKHGAAAKSARQRGNVITARTSRRVLFLPACFVLFRM